MSEQVKDTPDYKTPAAVLAAVELMQEPERVRASNRALIDALMNGRRPYTDAEVGEHQIHFNVNWGEGSKILQDANRQVNNALLHKGNLVTCKAILGPVEKREKWGTTFTTNLNRMLRRGRTGKKFLFAIKSRNASLVMHGIGAMMWSTKHDWMPKLVPLENLLIPTETTQDFENLTNFAVNVYLTPYELMTMTQTDPDAAEKAGWDMKAVRQILTTYGKLNGNNNQWNWWDQPQEMVNVWKQNAVVSNNDAVPKVHLVYFYYRSAEGGADGKEQWYRKICLKEVLGGEGVDKLTIQDKFVFDSGNTVFAEGIEQILSVQYGDCNLTTPQTYHSTRGLGEALYAVVECMNRLRCQWMQHVFENLLMLLRISNPADQDRPKIFNLKPYGVIEPGVDIVPKEQRHQVDPQLVESAMSENRQLMSENSASFVQEIDNGTGKEQTLGEAQIRLQTANKMVSGMLDMLYAIETFQFEEMVRRILLPNQDDPAVKKFLAACKADGIPDEMMKSECWLVDVDRVMGGGDKALAQQEAGALFAAKSNFDPSSQRIIDRKFVTALTGDPALAELLVPEKAPETTKGSMAAEQLFGTLMAGTQVGLVEGIEQQEYVGAMMRMFSAVVMRIQQTDNVGTQEDVIGLGMVANDIEKHLNLMAKLPANKEFVTAVSKELGKQMNEVKAFAQRQQEQSQEGQPDPEAIAKAQASAADAQQKLQFEQAKFTLQMQQSEVQFQQKLRQDEIEQQAKMESQMAELVVQLREMQTAAAAEISIAQERAVAEIEIQREKADAEIKSLKEKAAAQPAAAATE